MKKIVVMTDFSKPANHAAEVALEIAKRSDGQLLLFHTYSLPTVIPAEAGIYPYYEEYNLIEQEVTKKLDELAVALRSKAWPGTIDIAVSQRPLGSASNVVASINQKGMDLIVMGSKVRAEGVGRILFGSMITDVIDHASCPVLLVPQNAVISPGGKIVFASALEKNDHRVLAGLVTFAKFFDMEIVVVHVSTEELSHDEKEAHLKSFKQMSSKIDYLPITFQGLEGDSVPEALSSFSRMEDIELLAMVHTKYSFLNRLFRRSTTKSMIEYHKIPLLIWPHEQK